MCKSQLLGNCQAYSTMGLCGGVLVLARERKPLQCSVALQSVPSSACGLWLSVFQLCSRCSLLCFALVSCEHCGLWSPDTSCGGSAHLCSFLLLIYSPYFQDLYLDFLFIFVFQFPGGAPPGMPGGMPGMPGGLPGALGMGPRDLGPGAAVSLAQSLGLSRQEHLMSLAGSSAAAQAAMSAAMSSQASMTLGGPPSSHPSQPKMEAMSNVGLFSIFRISFLYRIAFFHVFSLSFPSVRNSFLHYLFKLD